MNKIFIGLTLAIGLAIGGYALISKLYETLHEKNKPLVRGFKVSGIRGVADCAAIYP